MLERRAVRNLAVGVLALSGAAALAPTGSEAADPNCKALFGIRAQYSSGTAAGRRYLVEALGKSDVLTTDQNGVTKVIELSGASDGEKGGKPGIVVKTQSLNSGEMATQIVNCNARLIADWNIKQSPNQISTPGTGSTFVPERTPVPVRTPTEARLSATASAATETPTRTPIPTAEPTPVPAVSMSGNRETSAADWILGGLAAASALALVIGGGIAACTQWSRRRRASAIPAEPVGAVTLPLPSVPTAPIVPPAAPARRDPLEYL